MPCEFINELSRGGLKVPTLSTVYFVHNAKNLHNNMELDGRLVVIIFKNFYFLLKLQWSSMIKPVNL